MTEYETLMGELETMAKAMPKPADGDANIAEAAGEPAAMKPGEDAGEGGAEAEAEEAEGDAPMAKSFEVEVGGERREAIEVDVLVKSLNEHSDARTAAMVRPLVDLVKAMHGELVALRTSAKPRKSVVAIADKPSGAPLAKSEPSALTPGEFLAKSDAAFTAGRISGVEFTTIDVSLRKGAPIDPSLIQRVVG